MIGKDRNGEVRWAYVWRQKCSMKVWPLLEKLLKVSSWQQESIKRRQDLGEGCDTCSHRLRAGRWRAPMKNSPLGAGRELTTCQFRVTQTDGYSKRGLDTCLAHRSV
jgi:hypothetical protein